MKLLTGWAVSAGLVLAVSAANAQMPAPTDSGRSLYRAASDFDRPYGGMPPAPPPYAYEEAPDVPYASDQMLLPPQEVYAVLRDNGFLPLGVPRQHGFVYEIAAMDRAGGHGRLLIDARSGRIIRLLPASREGRNYDDEMRGAYGAQAALPPPTSVRGVPRPPALIPHVANRPAPLKPPVAAQPSEPPAQQSAAAQPPATGTVGEAKPAPLIRPTQPMPQVQGLD